MTTTTTAPCSVTNDIVTPVQYATSAQTGWDGSVAILNAYNANPNDLQQGYAQTLQLEQFASGNDSLASGASDTLELDESTPLYNLIVAQANNLFPVLTTAEMLSFGTPRTFPPLTVDSDASASCANALQFFQNISAFPTSNLATGFTAACTSAGTAATSADDIDSAVDAYFQSTKGFQNVTFDSFIAAQSYLATFANAWANFATSYTYYLYKGSGAGIGEGGSAEAVGTVTFTQTPPSGVPSPTDTSGGYTITYENGGDSTTLYFSDQQLVSSTTVDIPPIGLQCTYAQLSAFSGNAADAETLVPIIFGNANGEQVMGINVEEPGPSWLQNADNFFQSNGMQVLMGCLGLLMGAKLVFDGLSWLKGKLTATQESNPGGAPPSGQQAAADRQQANENVNDAQPDAQAVADRVGGDPPPEVPAPAELPQAEAAVQAQLEQQQLADEAGGEADAILEQSDAVQAEASIGLTQAEEQVAEDEVSDMDQLQQLDPTNVAATESTLSSVGKQTTADNVTVSEIEQQIGGELSTTESGIAKNSEAGSEAEQDAANEEKAAEDDTAAGKDPIEDED